MVEKRRSRWFRFSLRTMFVLVTLLCIYLGWAMNWIQQRREFLGTEGGINSPLHYGVDFGAPAPLWILGEQGYWSIEVYRWCGDAEKAAKLFPEADIDILERPREINASVHVTPYLTRR